MLVRLLKEEGSIKFKECCVSRLQVLELIERVKALNDSNAANRNTIRREFHSLNKQNCSNLCPQHNPRVPRGYWKHTSVQQHELEKLGQQLGIKELDDWYSVDASAVKNRLSFIWDYYNGSLYTALKELYPQHDWDPLKLNRVPRGYWNDINTQRDALEKLGMRLGVKQLDDWYSVNTTTVKNELSFIATYYSGALLYNALKALYPQHDWNPLKFSRVPQGHWRDINAQRDALEKVGMKLGVKQLDDWYSVDAAVVMNELSCFMHYYNHSLSAALKRLYPQHDWDPLKFSSVPRGYWKDIASQRDALEKVGTQIGVKQLDDWYSVDGAIVKHELSFIMSYYNSSLYNALKALYPQHKWDPLKFSKVPHGYWNKPSTAKYFQRLFRKWKKEHNIQRFRDWYQLPPEQVRLFQRASNAIFGTVTKMLREWFPETNWMDEVQGSAPEVELQSMLRLVAGNIKLHHRIGHHSVDIFIPEWNLAIEYQGIQHYQGHWFGARNGQQQRDENKAEYLLQQGITLVPISYQWNGTWSQLRSTLRAVRQDSLTTSAPTPR